MPEFDRHHVYVLSLWRETPDAPWRAALRQAGSEERIGFANLEALALFLMRLEEDGHHTVIEADQAVYAREPEPAS